MSNSLWSRLVPERKETQFWMVSTFTLFVGAAVVLVALYVFFIFKSDVENALERTLNNQAERVALQMGELSTASERGDALRHLQSMTEWSVTVATPDTVLGSMPFDPDPAPTDSTRFFNVEALNTLSASTIRYQNRLNLNEPRVFYATLYRPESNMVVQVGQPSSPLYSLLERSQIVILAGMVLALILTVLGSWVAASKITTPLKRIRNTAQRVSRGQLTGRIRIDSRAAEFQDLAESLNRASDSFRDKINELERMAQLQSEFIGNVSHEVRNPIFSISGYLEALGTSRLSEEQRTRYAEKGLNNLQRLQNLFNDLIEIARLEYREDLIDRRVFNLKDLVDEVVEMLRPKADKKGLNLEVDIPSFEVNADRSRIRQVLVNLIENAIAYTDEGTVRCRVTRRKDKVRIDVVDTGKGIPEEHLERIFERFYRVDPHRSRESGGTGLGLSIVNQILQAHGESVSVESTEGRGTRFQFELPHATSENGQA
ncbi:sensor histidine kinase [Longimonas halophila]|nr:HAMP domain-containing sensor histidine kinase [Longimonas halophila]